MIAACFLEVDLLLKNTPSVCDNICFIQGTTGLKKQSNLI